MKTRRLPAPLTLTAIAALTATLAACGGGSGEAPPQNAGSVVVGAVPVVTITNNVSAETATGDITFNFAFNRDVGTSFSADDVTVTGGTKGAFSRISGTQASLVVSPTPDASGSVQVSVPAGAVTDAVGTANAATTASKAFNTVVRTTLVSFEESPPPSLIGFGGAEDATVVADPTDGSNKVARIVKNASAELWAGTTVALCPKDAVARIPFTDTQTRMSARVWSPAAGIPVRMKVENSADGTQSVETEATVTTANGWQVLTFDFARPATGTAALNPALTYDKVSVFFNFGATGASTGERTYFLDDLSFVGSRFTPACPVVTPPAGAATVLANFDDVAPPVAGFEGAEGSALEVGPAGGGTGKSFKVLRSGGQPFALGIIETTIPLTATRRTISAQVFSPLAGIPMVMKIEGPGGANSGDVAANEPVVVGWQTLTWTFANANPAQTFNKIVLLPRLGTVDAPPGQAYFFDAIQLNGDASPPATGTVIANFDDLSPPVAGFEGAEGSALEVGPAGGGTGKSFKVLRSGGQVYALGIVEAPIPVSATRRTISAKVYSPLAGIPMVMKIEGPGGANSGDVAANEPVVEGWQILTWTFASVDPAQTFNKIVLLPRLGTVDAPPGRAYFFDDIILAAAAGGGGVTGPVVFASGYRAGGKTAQGGDWGYFSGDFASYKDTFTGGGFADSVPPVADDAQYFYIAVTTSAPTAQVGNPPNSGGFLGMYVTHPGLTLAGQTQLAVNLGMDANFFLQPSNKNIDVFVVGSTNYSNGSGGDCKVTLKGSVTPTSDAMTTYTIALAGMSLVQPCNGGGFNSGVSTVAQALSQPIGAVNTQFTFPNVNTTINSGTAGAPIYATGITRGKTEFR